MIERTQAEIDLLAQFTELFGEAAEPQPKAEPVVLKLAPQRPTKTVKAGKMHRVLNRRDPFERVEYVPDNSRIGCASKGMQRMYGRDARVCEALASGAWALAARLMVQEFGLAQYGILPSYAFIGATWIEPQSDKPVSKFIGPQRDAMTIGRSEPLTNEIRTRLIEQAGWELIQPLE
jgi:hypothetical protein